DRLDLTVDQHLTLEVVDVVHGPDDAHVSAGIANPSGCPSGDAVLRVQHGIALGDLAERNLKSVNGGGDLLLQAAARFRRSNDMRRRLNRTEEPLVRVTEPDAQNVLAQRVQNFAESEGVCGAAER